MSHNSWTVQLFRERTQAGRSTVFARVQVAAGAQPGCMMFCIVHCTRQTSALYDPREARVAAVLEYGVMLAWFFFSKKQHLLPHAACLCSY